MGKTIRKNITIKDSVYHEINDFAKSMGMSFSEMLWRSALEKIKRFENQTLLEFLKENAPYASDEEQAEFDALIVSGEIDVDNISGKELTIEDILSGSL